MSISFKEGLLKALHLTSNFADEGSLVEMNANAALRRLDAITDGEAFRTVELRGRILDLLRSGVLYAQDWRIHIGFAVDEFEDLVEEIGKAPVLERH